MSVLNMQDQELKGKRVLIRLDLNVPLNNGEISNDARIQASLATIELALERGARVMLMSHLGRPVEGQPDSQYSLAPVAKHLSKLLGRAVRLEKEWLDGVGLSNDEIVLCENVRFNQGEKANDDDLAKRMADLCDIFVMDAFGTAHRAQASTHGVAKYAPLACAGPLLTKELSALSQAMDNPTRPIVAIVGGSKVSTKLEVLDVLSEKVDQLIVGGGIANTFIAAAGYEVGKSLFEPDLLDQARRLDNKAQATDGDIPIPIDVVCAKQFSENAEASTMLVDQIAGDDMVFDLGPKTVEKLAEIIRLAGTIVWNGPVGVFEFDQFGKGTEVIAHAVADSNAFSVAGGGDTVAAIDKYGVADKISYISTGGGAFLEFLEGKELPAVAILKERAEA